MSGKRRKRTKLGARERKPAASGSRGPWSDRQLAPRTFRCVIENLPGRIVLLAQAIPDRVPGLAILLDALAQWRESPARSLFLTHMNIERRAALFLCIAPAATAAYWLVDALGERMVFPASPRLFNLWRLVVSANLCIALAVGIGVSLWLRAVFRSRFYREELQATRIDRRVLFDGALAFGFALSLPVYAAKRLTFAFAEWATSPTGTSSFLGELSYAGRFNWPSGPPGWLGTLALECVYVPSDYLHLTILLLCIVVAVMSDRNPTCGIVVTLFVGGLLYLVDRTVTGGIARRSAPYAGLFFLHVLRGVVLLYATGGLVWLMRNGFVEKQTALEHDDDPEVLAKLALGTSFDRSQRRRKPQPKRHRNRAERRKGRR